MKNKEVTEDTVVETVTEEEVVATPSTKTVSVELTDEHYAFLTNWQKTHEKELGIEVPLSAMVRKAIEGTMKAQAAREDRPARPSFGGDRPPRRDGPSGGPRKSFGGDRGGFKPRMPGRGPKFDMLSDMKPRKKF